MFFGNPAVFDIDGDGTPEIVQGERRRLRACHEPPGGEPAGWPKFTNGWMIPIPVAGDVDGDGLLEVVAMGREGLSHCGTPGCRRTRRGAMAGRGHDRQRTGAVARACQRGWCRRVPRPASTRSRSSRRGSRRGRSRSATPCGQGQLPARRQRDRAGERGGRRPARRHQHRVQGRDPGRQPHRDESRLQVQGHGGRRRQDQLQADQQGRAALRVTANARTFSGRRRSAPLGTVTVRVGKRLLRARRCRAPSTAPATARPASRRAERLAAGGHGLGYVGAAQGQWAAPTYPSPRPPR